MDNEERSPGPGGPGPSPTTDRKTLHHYGGKADSSCESCVSSLEEEKGEERGRGKRKKEGELYSPGCLPSAAVCMVLLTHKSSLKFLLFLIPSINSKAILYLRKIKGSN